MRGRGPVEVIRRRWRWAAGAVLAGLLAGGAAYVGATPTYQATASTFFSLQYGNSAADLVQGSTYTQAQVQSFARLATTPVVLQPVIDQLGLHVPPAQLAGQVSASAPVDTVMVQVTVTDGSAGRSARIANAVAASLSHAVEDLAPRNSSGAPTVQATTVAPAEVPAGPASPDLPLDLAAGLLAGLVLGVGLGALREITDTRVRDVETLATVTSLPVVGTIGHLPRHATSRVVVEVDPHGPVAESVRQLRTNLRFLQLDGARPEGLRVVAVTSAVPGEGKSTVATNLAAALAEVSGRVLLVDADLRRPSVARGLGIEGGAGLTTVMAGDAELADVVQEWGTSGLHVLPSGPLPPNPTEMLGSPALARLLEQARGSYDVVVVDSAPVLPVADAAVLSRVVDGLLVVANAEKVRRHQLAEILRDLARVDGHVLGIVLNRVHRDEDSYTYRSSDSAAAPFADWATRPDRPADTPVGATASPPAPRTPPGAPTSVGTARSGRRQRAAGASR